MDPSRLSVSELVDEVIRLRRENEKLREELDGYKQKNPRGAGRKRADEKWTEGYARFMTLYEKRLSRSEIMKECGISQATYYRHKRLYDETVGKP